MSADLLRRAATVLRETAAATTPGPWEFTPGMYDGDDRGAITSTSLAAVGWDALILDVPNGSEHRAAEWIALMSPIVAGPMALWLDSVAAFWANEPHAVATSQELAEHAHALVLARTILGEATS